MAIVSIFGWSKIPGAAWLGKLLFSDQNDAMLALLLVLAPQAASTVRHLMLPAHWTQRTSLVTDLVACYGCGGRSIVFTETKNDANDLAASLSEIMGAR